MGGGANKYSGLAVADRSDVDGDLYDDDINWLIRCRFDDVLSDEAMDGDDNEKSNIAGLSSC
jgi:hypothetical protein